MANTSYTPIPRCIAIPCSTNSSDLSYFVFIQIAQCDSSMFIGPTAMVNVNTGFTTLSCADGTLQYQYNVNFAFTDPSSPGSGGTFDLLLPCCPTNGPAATSFIMNWNNPEVNIYPPGTTTKAPITTSTPTINPPKARPVRSEPPNPEVLDDPFLFIIQSNNDSTNQSIGVALNIPANINPRLVPGVPSSDDTQLSLAAVELDNSDAYDLAIYCQQPLGSIASVYVTFPDGSLTDVTPINGSTPVFKF